MPTPLEVLFDPISLACLAIFAGLMALEAWFPGRALARVRGWRARGLLTFGAFFYLSSYLPMLWDGYLARFQLFDLGFLGVTGATLAGLLVYELGAWVYHAALHRSNALWRVHQWHHSAERLDVAGSFFFHPLDMVGWTALASLCLVLIVGVPAQAATNILLITFFLGVFQHTNVRTPRWLGYLVQRPESHTVHHARGVHGKNYSDLPLFDILFGTFENPRGYEHETGFYEGASARLGDLLVLRDVTQPERKPAAVGSVSTTGA